MMGLYSTACSGCRLAASVKAWYGTPDYIESKDIQCCLINDLEDLWALYNLACGGAALAPPWKLAVPPSPPRV